MERNSPSSALEKKKLGITNSPNNHMEDKEAKIGLTLTDFICVVFELNESDN